MADETKREKSDEGWEGVAPAANESEAALIAGFLENHGIPARVVDRSFHQTPTENEDLSPIEVAVPASRAGEARTTLARRDKAFEKDPGSPSALQTDEGPTDVPPEGEGGAGNLG
jgi:hypothetical protein